MQYVSSPPGSLWKRPNCGGIRTGGASLRRTAGGGCPHMVLRTVLNCGFTRGDEVVLVRFSENKSFRINLLVQDRAISQAYVNQHLGGGNTSHGSSKSSQCRGVKDGFNRQAVQASSGVRDRTVAGPLWLSRPGQWILLRLGQHSGGEPHNFHGAGEPVVRHLFRTVAGVLAGERFPRANVRWDSGERLQSELRRKEQR